MKKEEYNIGLDIGTNSVGWCVINKNGKLLQFKKKNMWGARLFEKGDTAEKCRIYRSTRRRYERRRQRIRLLQEMMEPMLLTVDESFFIRLEEAFLWKEDKKLKTDYILFHDKNYSDIQFYKEFPTRYHLRKYLLETDEKVDPRKIYLALHHMIKYRGHFLYQGQKFDAIASVQEAFKVLLQELAEQLEIELEYSEECFSMIESILKGKKGSKKEKQEKITELLAEQGMDKKYAKELVGAFIGYSFDLTKLMQDDELRDESGKMIKISFADAKYEEMETQVQDLLQERFSVIEALKGIYSWMAMEEVLRGKTYLSEAMVEKYEKHHKELIILKQLFKKYLPETEYRDFFRKEKMNGKNYAPTYANYIQGTGRCSKDALYKEIKNLLDKAAKEDETYQAVLVEMEKGEYLSKQNEVNNAYIPYQLNEIEMELILEKQGQFYPELKENKEKILKLLTFKIPYFVGPLNSYKHEGQRSFAWMSKKAGKEKEKIYPWNFEEVVDIDETAEKFITRMTSFCTYLPEEKVLPKQSLLYAEYEVLQELNKIRINGRLIAIDDKKKIIEEVFKKQKRVTDKVLKKWLLRMQYGEQKEEKVKYEITGYQKENEFASSLTAYIDFTRIFGEINSKNHQMIEEIIYWLTVFEEKSIVKRKIKQKYGNEITQEQLKKILKLKYTGWGRLSEKFLNGIKGYNKNHEKVTIMEILREDRRNLNLMQIIHDKEMGFCDIIEEKRKRLDENVTLLKAVNDLQGSPAIKRGIWQSLQIVEEIIKIMDGEKPQQIFIEFAREEGEKVRTNTRLRQIQKAYDKLKEEVYDFNIKVETELKDKMNQKRLDEEKVFLYYLQNGKSLYSGEALNLDELDQYEVDHILPRSFIKDDSLDNKALVKKKENQIKGNHLVLEIFDKKKVQSMWDYFYQCGLMSPKKYAALQKETFEEKDTKKFIRRQLVETRQIVKHVANLIGDYYKDEIKVVEIKAELSSEFRQTCAEEEKDENGYVIENTDAYTLLKSRAMNDFHHAQDAYLACIIGLYIKAAYPKYEEEIDYTTFKKYYNEAKKDKKQKFSFILSKFEKQLYDADGVEIWNGTKAIEYIQKIFAYRDCIITKKLEENTGAFYNETIYPKSGDNQNTKLIPLKKGLDVSKYGGYQGGEAAYFTLLEYEQKNKKKLVLQGISIMAAKKIADGETDLETYLQELLKVDSVTIIRNKVQKNQLIEDAEGNRFYLTAATEVVNAKQFVVGGKQKEFYKLIHMMEKGDYKGYQEDEVKKWMDEFYDFFKAKIKKQYLAYESVINKIDESGAYENLREKSLKELGSFFLELLKLTKANPECANMKKFDEKKLADRMGRKGGYSIKTGTTFIDQSVTGLYERRQTI